MSSIRARIFAVFAMLFFLSACSSDGEVVDGGEENLPKVNKKEFSIVKRGDYVFELYKKMSLNHSGSREIISASYLPEEFHLSVESYSKKNCVREEGFPKDRSKQLEWFAEFHSSKLERQLMSFEVEAPEKVFVNESDCFKKQISGRAFGFPKQKHFFLRYYKFGNDFIAIIGWTTEGNVTDFKPIINYMGMTFRSGD